MSTPYDDNDDAEFTNGCAEYDAEQACDWADYDSGWAMDTASDPFF